MSWRPLSKRGAPDARLDEPHEGLPAHIKGPALAWLHDQFQPSGYEDTAELTKLQLRFRLDPPFAAGRRLMDLLARCGEDQEFALDVLDYTLFHLGDSATTPSLTHARSRLGKHSFLVGRRGASNQSPAMPARSGWPEERLAPFPMRCSSVLRRPEPIPTSSGHGTGVLAEPGSFWSYREAVRAVEAAAKPVVLPQNDRATLGTMIAALRDKPDKWETRIGTIDDVRRQMELLWTNQLDRHGTDDETVPLQVDTGAGRVGCSHRVAPRAHV